MPVAAAGGGGSGVASASLFACLFVSFWGQLLSRFVDFLFVCWVVLNGDFFLLQNNDVDTIIH